jgi:hypothetical protein
MQIFVKTLSGKTEIVDVNRNDTVGGLKKLLACIDERLDCSRLKLVSVGRIMDENARLSDYDIQLESTIHMIYRKIYRRDDRISGG